MIKVGEVLVSDDIRDVEFICHLEKCKGACCVEGDLGAPLEEDELAILNNIQQQIKPYLTPEGSHAIAKQGAYVLDEDGDYSTPIIEGKECAYSYYAGKVLKCSIEQAYLDGKIMYRKPISCHLYPIRITKNKMGFEAVNYHQWTICSEACVYGKSLQVPLYQFLKDPLIRKYGQKWYDELVTKIQTIFS